LADSLTNCVPAMAGGPRVERRAPAPRKVLRHVGSDLECTARGDELAGVIALVAAQRDATSARQPLIGHRHCGTPLGSAVGRLDLQINEQGVAVFRQGIGRVAQLGLFTLALAGQQCLRVGGRLMGSIRATLAVEIYGWIALIIIGPRRLLALALEALERSP